MSKTLVAAVAGLFMLPVAAHAEDAAPVHFTDRGVDYSYTTETKGDVRILRGSAYNGREPFELRVTKAGVTGTFNGKDVEFSQYEIGKSGMVMVAAR